MVVPLKEISIVNLLKLNNPIIIDIRKSYDFNISHIPNSINIPYLDFIIEFSLQVLVHVQAASGIRTDGTPL